MIRSQKTAFLMIRFQKNVFFQKKKVSARRLSKRFGQNEKIVQKIDPKIYLKKSGAKIQPKSQAKSYKKSIQISKQQRGAASGAAPFLGCCFEI